MKNNSTPGKVNKASNKLKNSELNKKALNPQPLPPKASNPMGKKALNPQPLPPKQKKSLGRKVG